MQNFKDLKVWQKAHQLTLDFYQATNSFPKEEMYGIVAQLRRSASSIPSNIAEGCGRKSNLELANFLNISLGSTNETEYFVLLAKDLSFLNTNEYERLSLLINEVKAMLISLIQKVRS